MNPDPKSYILSESESRAIFEEKIVPAELDNLTTGPSPPPQRRQPLAVFVIGQTGAGKTRTAPALKAAMMMMMAAGAPAHFIADTYKAYHPAYAALLRAAATSGSRNPGLASQATGPDARRWLAMAVRRAAARRLDVLVESACRHEGDFADLARVFKEEATGAGEGEGHDSGTGNRGGYRVEVALVAVPAALSLLGILTRFHAGLPEAGSGNLPPRLTPRKVHDDSYAGVLGAAAFIDGDVSASGGGAVVDQVVVVRRDNLVAYANERVAEAGEEGGGRRRRWARPGSAVEAVLAERRRPLTENEWAVARADVQRLRDMKIPGVDAQLEEVEVLLRTLGSAGPSDGDPEFPALKPWRLPNTSSGRGTSHELDEDLEFSLRLGT
ncbi:hypothetical protein SLS62_006570 [Diatrype stigma]|uniref:Zeta toxin domain-containing protein n=1 Tax=Diatrype stigma TaxID=117547 RepID=A0AAN9UMZ9_9PEZI